MSLVMGLDDVICRCRYLQSLYVQVESKIHIPSTLYFHEKLTHLYLSCPEDEMSMQFICALCREKNMTHLYLLFKLVPQHGPFELLLHLLKLTVLEIVSLLAPCRNHANLRKDIFQYAKSNEASTLSSFTFVIGRL